ncbi:MAG: phage tail sheath family protein [Gammaproteobacteria bacterium]|nr:phage tail sheath family protein [Gammaproteobacteria bacterium]
MPTYRTPGVYINEITEGPPPITGVATAIAAFVDVFAQGPLQQPVRINSHAEFETTFGTTLNNSPASPSSQGIRYFFANGGRTAWVVRIPGSIASAVEVIGSADARSGLHALDGVDLFNILCLPCAVELPDADMQALYTAALDSCTARRAFLIIDIPATVATPTAMLDWLAQHATLRQRNAAVYFPRLTLQPRRLNKRMPTVAASGVIAGLYARIDATRGVWKAPAGKEADLRGIYGLACALKETDIDTFQAAGVNVLRNLESGMPVCWGARTLTNTDPEWKYIPVRRLALHIETCLEHDLVWAVFELNGEQLWQKVRRVVENFLAQLFRQGALAGTLPDQAYFVRADRTTMTQDDIDHGRLNLLVGFAPLKPAEFVMVRIQLQLGA